MNDPMTCSRREFLRRAALLGLGLCATSLTPAVSFATPVGRSGHAVSATRVMLGTIVSITAVHPSKTLAEEGLGRAFLEMQRLSAIFDRYRPGTALSVLNDRGHLEDAPDDLVEVMNRSIRYNSLSAGAFDVTVAPVIDLYKGKAAQEVRSLPTAEELDMLLDLVDSREITLSGRVISYERAGMRASLDGIAKGYIVDRASEVLSAMGLGNHLVNAGGDIRTSGANPGGGPWRIALEDPLKRGNPVDRMHMGNGAVATSGGYEIYFDDQRLHHHIVSPASGRSPNRTVSVSVRADTVMEADALSTAVFVMGPRDGLGFIDGLPGRECLVVGSGGRVYASRRWRGTREGQ